MVFAEVLQTDSGRGVSSRGTVSQVFGGRGSEHTALVPLL